jgi:hypothetical protein
MIRAALVVSLVLLGSCGGGGTGETASTGEASTSSASGATGTTGSSTTGEPTSTGEPGSSSGAPTTGSTGEPGSTGGSTGAPEPTWRSELYPEDWTPDFTGAEGRFLHDFSYAGYHNGEAELGADLPATTIDVVADHGADATGMSDATAALQAAIDAAEQAGGAIVMLPPGLYRVDGQLAVGGSRVVIRGAGAEQSRLWFTDFTDMSYKAHLTIGAAPQLGADAPLVEDAAARSRIVRVADPGLFKVGDDVAVGWEISPEFIAEHGMDGTWMAFNDTWQVFFWRTVTGVDAQAGTLELDVPLRYPALTRDAASVRPVTGILREVAVEDIGVANAVGWEDAWSQDQVYAIALIGVADAWVRGVRSFVSPGAPQEDPGALRHLQSGGITVQRSKRVTIADSTLELAQHRGGGGNGYLFEISQSSEILTRDCVGRAGRHNFIQNWGFGATGIVWLRIDSSEGKAVAFMNSEVGTVGLSEYHHSLATANLVDQSVLGDGWGAVNRGSYSTGAGHSATQSAVWNASGSGVVRSRQYGHGYVIGAGPEVQVETGLGGPDAAGSEPEDWVEGPGKVGTLVPASLYEDQLARRLGG